MIDTSYYAPNIRISIFCDIGFTDGDGYDVLVISLCQEDLRMARWNGGKVVEILCLSVISSSIFHWDVD